MTRITGIISSTHVDAHGDQMTLSVLESMVGQINEGILLINNEHDPRNAPVGRIISAKLIQLEDGEFAVEGIFELYDCDLSELTDLGERKIGIREFSEEKLSVCYDRAFNDTTSQKDIKELCEILNTDLIVHEVRKALDPMVILTIGGVYILGNIASGFFESIGTEAYNLLKVKLGEISQKKQKDSEEVLIIFEFTVINEEIKYDVELILTNPTVEDIDSGIRSFYRLDEILPVLFKHNPRVRKLVFEYLNDGLKLKYGIDLDGIPLIFK
jgi:hypothetical protein